MLFNRKYEVIDLPKKFHKKVDELTKLEKKALKILGIDFNRYKLEQKEALLSIVHGNVFMGYDGLGRLLENIEDKLRGLNEKDKKKFDEVVRKGSDLITLLYVEVAKDIKKRKKKRVSNVIIFTLDKKVAFK